MISSSKSIVALYIGAVAIFVAAIMYTSFSTQQLVNKAVSLGNSSALNIPSGSTGTTTETSYSFSGPNSTAVVVDWH